jgi:hypothetical protein
LGGIVPELAVTFMGADGEIIVTPTGPFAKILFGELCYRNRIEPKRPRGINGSTRRTRVTRGIRGQGLTHRFQMISIPEIGWSIGGMDCSFDTID